jgi:virulence-associated protein VapD
VIEESLVHKPFITLDTLHGIAVCKSFSVCIVQDRKYYDIISAGNDVPFIIEKVNGRYSLYIGLQTMMMNYIAYIRMNYWRMESITAPIRTISAYKLQDLIDISTKLGLPISSILPGKFGSVGTEKRKTKPELYEAICRCV